MDISIIIVNYNLSNECEKCIQSVIKFSDGVDYEIILIDNNSIEKSIKEVANRFSLILKNRFIFIELDMNIGFGNACNNAAFLANGMVLFFLNPDTILEENIFEKLRKNESTNDLFCGNAIVGLNVNASKIMDFSAGYFPSFFFEIINIISIGRIVEAFLISLASRIYSQKVKVDWVMGAALLISKKLFTDVGGFSKEYFLYFEEMDLCKKVKNENKYVFYLPSIYLNHIGSVSTKKNYYFFTKMFYKGKLLFLIKYNTYSVSVFFLKLLFRLHIYGQIMLWKLLVLHNPKKSKEKINAFIEILKNIETPLRISNNSGIS